MVHSNHICPNCGAQITNLQNCEFCGSLLIRLQQQGINIEQAGYKDENKVFKGLVGALKQNLELQKATNLNEKNVLTEIIYDDYCIGNVANAGLNSSSGERFFPNIKDGEKNHLVVGFKFSEETKDGLRRFRNLDIYELFKEKVGFDDDNNKFYEYVIDFGADAEGAAHLLSKIIHEVEAIPYDAMIDYYTNSGDDIEINRAILRGESEDTIQLMKEIKKLKSQGYSGEQIEKMLNIGGQEKQSNYSWIWWLIAIGVGLIVFFASM